MDGVIDYQRVFDNMREGCQIIGFDWRYRYLNPVAAHYGRQPKEALLGHTVMECYPGIEQVPLFALLTRCMNERTADEAEFEFDYPDGTQAWFSFRVQPIPEGLFVLTVDITQSKEANNELARAQRYHARLQENVSEAVIVTDLAYRIQSWNAAAERIYGWRAEEVMGSSVARVLRTEYVATEDGEQSALSTLQRGWWQGEVVQRHKDGSTRNILGSVSIVRDDKDTPIGVVAINYDITERKRAEVALRQSAAEIHDLYNNAPCGYHSLDADSVFVQINDTELRWLGYQREEVINRLKLTDILTPASQEAFSKNFPAFKASGALSDVELDLIRKDGSILPVLVNGIAIYDENGQYLRSRSSLFDMTELKRVRDALNASLAEERELHGHLSALQEITIELTQEDDLDTFYRRAIELGLARLGFERLALFLYDEKDGAAQGTYGTDAQGKIMSERHIRFVPGPEHIMSRAFDRPERYFFVEKVHLYADMQPVGIGWNAGAALWNGKQNLGWLVMDTLLSHTKPTVLFISIMRLYALTLGSLLAQKQTQNALREGEANYRHLVESMHGGLAVYDVDDRITFINDRACEILGYPREELLGTRLYDYVDEAGNREIKSQLERRRQALNSSYEMLVPHRSGREVYVLIASSPLFDKNGAYNGSLVVITDITTQKQAEGTLRQALAKEKELGDLKSRFVSMASHEFRTPLATILASAESLSAYRTRMTDEQIDKRLQTIHTQVGHLKDIMEDVLQLARMQARRTDFNPVLLDLDALCRSVIDEFRENLGKDHHLRYHSDTALREVRLDKKLMRQIISNLVSNAIKYSAAGTEVEITLQSVESHLHLTIRDQGLGIPQDDLQHLFEPFHRGRNVGLISGTGLGLSIVKEAVELHHGTMAVDSTVGQGTTITVTIPFYAPSHAPSHS